MSGDWSRVNVLELDPGFYHDCVILLNEQAAGWVVTEGHRSMSRSNDLFVDYRLHDGPRAAPGGLSPHNYGMAIDVALDGDEIKPGLQALWLTTDKRWLSLITAIWNHPRLRSGKWYSDWPHIEKLHWKDYAAWRQNYENNLTYLRGVAGLSRFLPTKAKAA